MNRTAIAALAAVLALAACGGEPTPDPADQVVGGFGDLGPGEPVPEFEPRILSVVVVNETDVDVDLWDAGPNAGNIPSSASAVPVPARSEVTYEIPEERTHEERGSAKPSPRVFCAPTNSVMAWYAAPVDPALNQSIRVTFTGEILNNTKWSFASLDGVGTGLNCPEDGSMPAALRMTLTREPGPYGGFTYAIHVEWGE